MEDQRQVVDYARQVPRLLGELREQELRRVLFPHFPETLLDALACLFGLHFTDEPVDVYGVVPDVESTHSGIVRHALAIGPYGGGHGAGRVGLGEADMAPRQHDAGHQPLQIPLPWRRQCFVEVVDVENHTPFRRRKTAEVR